jgi:hypothetical protein
LVVDDDLGPEPERGNEDSGFGRSRQLLVRLVKNDPAIDCLVEMRQFDD